MCEAGSNFTQTIVDFSVLAVQMQIQYPQMLHWFDTPTLGLSDLLPHFYISLLLHCVECVYCLCRHVGCATTTIHLSSKQCFVKFTTKQDLGLGKQKDVKRCCQ